MSPKALKIRVIPAAMAAAALFCAPLAFAQRNTTAASSMLRAPASSADQEAREAKARTTMAQSDAFSTAGEQAAFLGAYQMSFGPYGGFNGSKEDRQKVLRETAVAIEECINGRACGSDKQEKVLKALIQFNMGQDIKMMMLTNNTNQERMRSLDNSSDSATLGKGQAVLSQAEIQKAISTGRDFTVDQSDPIKPYQQGKITQLTRGSESTKEATFSLDENSVTHKIDGNYLREREILGEKFLTDYSAFLDDFATTGPKNERRFYKYVPSKVDKQIYVYDADRSGISVDQERFSEVQRDQSSRPVREALDNYKKNLKPIRGYQSDDGRAYITSEGSNPQELGIGDMADVDPAMFPGMKFDDLMQDGKIAAGNRGRAIARIINETIKENAKKKETERLAANRSLASRDDKSDPKWIHTATLSPEEFDKFLDDIWPSSVTRKQLISTMPAEQTAVEPTQADDRAPTDRHDMRPTDNRRPVNTKYYQGE